MRVDRGWVLYGVLGEGERFLWFAPVGLFVNGLRSLR
jgi:hypothetical protein